MPKSGLEPERLTAADFESGERNGTFANETRGFRVDMFRKNRRDKKETKAESLKPHGGRMMINLTTTGANEVWDARARIVARLAADFERRGVSAETAKAWAEAETPPMNMITGTYVSVGLPGGRND